MVGGIFSQLAFFCLYKCTRTCAEVVSFGFAKLPTAMTMVNQSRSWSKGLLISVKILVFSNSSTIGSHLSLIRG